MDKSDASIIDYQATTLPFSTKPIGIVKPTNREAIQKIVQQARKDKSKLHVVSAGKNWGYSDRLAGEHACIIVDLSAMNRILEINIELGYAIIEPGVTQGQLFQYLEEHKIPLWMDGNGAGPDTSIIGNYLERGFGHTPLGERCQNSSALEVVLGTGEVLRTGFNISDGFQPSDFGYKHGVGPNLEGLFFQSNFGIVTQMAIWLMPKPKSFAAFYVGTDTNEGLLELVHKIQELRLEGVLKSSVHIGNVMRTIMSATPYPWHLTNEQRALSESFWRNRAKDMGLRYWNGSGAIYGEPEFVKTSMNIIRDRLKRFFFLSIDAANQNPALQDALGILQGKPTKAYLQSAAWRSRSAKDSECDPIKNGAGLVWFAPLLPATAQDTKQILEKLSQIYRKYDFDLPITFTFVNDRSMIATTNISYDKTQEKESQQAWKCLEELIEQVSLAGYPPYRLPLGTLDKLPRNPGYAKILSKLKSTFDPDGILSPKRYVAVI